MFRVGETYECKNGNSILIVAVDTDMHYSGVPCPILGLCTGKGQLHPNAIYGYNNDGWYCGVDPKKQESHAAYCIISNEPTEEENALMREIVDYGNSEKADNERLLKIIRQLRKK